MLRLLQIQEASGHHPWFRHTCLQTPLYGQGLSTSCTHCVLEHRSGEKPGTWVIVATQQRPASSGRGWQAYPTSWGRTKSMYVDVWHGDSQWQLMGTTVQSSSTAKVRILPPQHRTLAVGLEQQNTNAPVHCRSSSHFLLTKGPHLGLTVALHTLSLQLLSLHEFALFTIRFTWMGL